jgi:hypothetical protein
MTATSLQRSLGALAVLATLAGATASPAVSGTQPASTTVVSPRPSPLAGAQFALVAASFENSGSHALGRGIDIARVDGEIVNSGG